MIVCPPLDPALGIAVRLSAFMSCESRALGENGFQALAGGPMGMALLSGLLTIFVALIGYRLILGDTPNIRDGVTWMVRVGLVLALVTSWPAFQTLIFRTVVDGPAEVASILLPASGIPTDDLDARVQRAYDTLRLGGAFHSPTAQDAQGAAASVAQAAMYQSAMPQTASLFVLSTSGITGAFQIAIGFLLAIAPLPIMALLFDGAHSIVAGWVRALAGAALASLAAIIVTSTHLLAVESELAHLQAIRVGGHDRVVDPQGLTTIVLVFLLTTLVTSFAAMRVASAFRMHAPHPRPIRSTSALGAEQSAMHNLLLHDSEQRLAAAASGDQSRADRVAGALAATMRREQLSTPDTRTLLISSSQPEGLGARAGSQDNRVMQQGLGTVSRRTLSRRTRSSVRRDRAGQ